MRPPLRALLSLAVAIPLTLGLSGLPAHADAASSMADPIYQRANPTSDATLTTPWADEANDAARVFGYSTDLGVAFNASIANASGLTAVHRLYNNTTVDFTEALAGSAAYSAARSAGYSDQGVSFYALANAVTGRTMPVHSYVKSGKHRLAAEATGASLLKGGWQLSNVAFHVAATTQTPMNPPTAPPGTNPPPVGSGDAQTDAGSIAVGTASYAVPGNAVIVSTSGNDSNSGSAAAPVRTIQKGVALAPTGGTVVVRAGVYRETVTISRSVTVQNYPNEAVWLDGSTPVTGWVADGGIWRRSGWNTRFDSSPTYTQGAAENPAPDWRFVNVDEYPMAAHPDQVFVNGVALQQVKARSLVKPGTFYLDERTSELFIGSNPKGQNVEASTIVKAMSVRGADSVIRGIGIRRFSPSVFHIGAVTIEQPGVTLENVVVMNAATTGLSVLREDVTLDQVTVTSCGMLGIGGRFADNLQFSRVLSTKNNTEHFNIAPVSGGVKLAQSRGITSINSSFSGNYGHGFWEDMSVYDSIFRQSDFSDNSGTGLFLEISAKAIVGDNTFSGNRQFGIKVNNTSDVEIWNNTFVGNGRPLNLVQDARRNTDKSDPAVDFRVAFPDPAMPWTLGPVTVRNNVIADSTTAANCLLCVEDYSFKNSAEQMGVTANSNVYARPSASQPTWLAVWSRANVNGNPYTFTSLSALQATTGQEKKGREYIGTAILDEDLNLSPSVKSQEATIAESLPVDVATAIGREAGSNRLGRW